MPTVLKWTGWIAGWAWFLLAGAGGFGLILVEGPWPPTNGWFAMLSGIAGCPGLAWLLARYGNKRLPFWVQFAAALALFLAGRAALHIWPHDHVLR
ncbi:MAG TPA: hypothetical protein VGF77_14150 [Allosphingosinicella sp.]